MKVKVGTLIVVFVLSCCALCVGQTNAKANDPWTAWHWLAGKWSSSGGGTPGQGAGWVSFEFDLDKHILVRKNHVDYPAAKERPAFAHDDLLVTYREQGSERFLADYWDNEGHLIRYTAGVMADGTIQFVSAQQPGQPAFRITYIKASTDEIRIRFEIAPPDKPGEFKVYAEGAAKRQK